ncbi:MAG: hypothetical protein QM771_11810 [Nitrospira sp.]
MSRSLHRPIIIESFDECYYCKLCYNHCPYTPPHQYGIDFPLLMAVWKKRLAAVRGIRWRDWLLTRTDLLGRLNSALAPLVNWGLGQKWLRSLMQTMLGVHQEREVLHYQQETFTHWWGRRSSAGYGGYRQKSRLVCQLPRQLSGNRCRQGDGAGAGEKRYPRGVARPVLLRDAFV